MAQYRPTDAITSVVKNLIIANVLVFIAQNYFSHIGRPLEEYAALWSIGTGNFRVWQLVTHLFMHMDLFHILFNMYGLWVFGSILESFWGPKRFLQFYVLCGLAAGLTQLALQRSAFLAMGASGAVMGVLAAFGYLRPNTELMMLFIPIPIKAKYFISALILVDVFGVVSPQQGDQTGHYAHLGGALAGLIFVVLRNRTNRRDFY